MEIEWRKREEMKWSPRRHALPSVCLICIRFCSVPEQDTLGLPRAAALSSEHPCHSVSLTQWLSAQIRAEHRVTYSFGV